MASAKFKNKDKQSNKDLDKQSNKDRQSDSQISKEMDTIKLENQVLSKNNKILA